MTLFGGLCEGNRCANNYFYPMLDRDCDVQGALLLENTSGDSKISIFEKNVESISLSIKDSTTDFSSVGLNYWAKKSEWTHLFSFQ